MGSKATSTRRSTATSTRSNQTTTIFTGSGYSVSGAVVSPSTSISLGVVTPGSTSSSSSVSVAGGGPTITSIQYLDANNVVMSDDIAVSTAGGNILINGSGFVSNSIVYLNNSAISNTFLSSTQIRATCPPASSGNVALMIFTPTNTGVISPNGVRYSGVPSWTTSAVSFQNNASANVALSVSGDSTLTYTLQAGSTLPTGISLVSSGFLSGTATGYSDNTSVSVVIIATDEEGQATQQTINITIIVSDAKFPSVSLLLNGDTGSNVVNGATNNSFVDSSNNNYTITRNGNVTQGTFSPFSQTGWSNYFDGGATTRLTLTSSSNLAFGSGAYTMEGWVYISASPTYVTTLFDAGGATNSISLGVLASGAVAIGKYGIGNVMASTAGDVPLHQWVHIAAVRASTASNDTKLYVNGVLKATGTDNNNWTVVTTPTVGGINISGYTTTGYISNLRVVKGSAVYTTAFTPSTAPLTAISNTQLLTCNSNRFIDNSTNTFTVTPTNNPSVQAFSPFSPSSSYSPSVHGGSAYFDGNNDSLTTTSNAYVAFGTGDFTIECWIYMTGTGGGYQAFMRADDSSATCIDFGHDTSGNTIKFQSKTAAMWSTSYTFPLNTWTHVAACRSSSAFRIYINGVPQGSGTLSMSTSWTAPTTNRIGGSNYSSTHGVLGYMSDLRVIKGTALYTGAFTPPTAPLTAVGNTSLLLNYTNGGVVDAHSSNAIETAGNAQLSTSVKKFGDASMSFVAASSQYLKPMANPLYAFGTGDFTVECWVYILSHADYRTIFDIRTSDLDANGLVFGTNAAGQSYFYNAGYFRIAAGSISTNTWTHLAWVRQNGVFTSYVNGSSVGTATVAINVTNNAPTIGKDWNSLYYFNGYMDDFRITKGFARYTANFTAPTSAFIAQ